MTRTLIAFGDSHTAGAEIEEQYNYECFSKAYPAYIAKYYGFKYKNFSEPGGSNDLLIERFNEEIKKVITKKEKVFVLFNFTEASRTFIRVKSSIIGHDYINFYPSHLTDEFTVDNEYERDIKLHLPIYRHYIMSNTNETLDKKSINQMFIVQTICQKYDIPFIFHNSINWYYGDWSLIDKKHHFGHHKSNTFDYQYSSLMDKIYSFWGVATHHPDWKHLRYEDRWHGHYPEEFHKFWASKLIKFIDEQKILEGYI